MSITQPPVPANYTLQNEVASRMILLNRDVVDIGNGSVQTTFGCSIIPKSITYELDANQNKIGIYDSWEMNRIEVPQSQVMSLFDIQVTLADGTVSYFGEVLSNFVDQIISAQVPDIGTITTQHINIQAVLAAQQASQTPVTDSGTSSATIVPTAASTATVTEPANITISGSVEIAGATVSDGTNTTISDVSGNYSLIEPYNWSGTITPTLTGYTFIPANITYSNVITDQVSQIYTPTIA